MRFPDLLHLFVRRTEFPTHSKFCRWYAALDSRAYASTWSLQDLVQSTSVPFHRGSVFQKNSMPKQMNLSMLLQRFIGVTNFKKETFIDWGQNSQNLRPFVKKLLWFFSKFDRVELMWPHSKRKFLYFLLYNSYYYYY